LLTLDTENQILARTISSRQENLEIVETRYSAGLTNEIDLQRARTVLSSVGVQLENNQRQRTEIELRLATLSGQSASSFSIENTGIQYLAPVIEPDAPNSLAKNRPDIQAADYTIEAYKKQVESARKNKYPSLYLQGSAGLLTGNSDQLFEGESRNWLVGATLSVPLFEGGRRQAQLAISDHLLQAAVDNLKQQELGANPEVERALSNLSRLNKQLEAQQDFLLAAQKAAELSGQRYRKGLVTYLEVVDAERIVLEAERLSAQLLGQQLISTIDLVVAMGGDLGDI
jgi:multidrug efflux system outer membrane protein